MGISRWYYQNISYYFTIIFNLLIRLHWIQESSWNPDFLAFINPLNNQCFMVQKNKSGIAHHAPENFGWWPCRVAASRWQNIPMKYAQEYGYMQYVEWNLAPWACSISFWEKKKPRVIIFYHIWSAPFAHGRYGAWGFILIILGTFGSTTGPLEKMLKKDGNCAWLLNIVHHRPNAGIRAVHLSASQPNVCGIKKSRGAYWIRWNISFVFSKPYDYYRIWLQSILWWSHLILLVIKNVL